MSRNGRKRGADENFRNGDGNHKVPRQETHTPAPDVLPEPDVPHAGLSNVAECIPGSLKRIYLENFMCHNKLEINLGRHINFIVGENGAGKSAILTALFVCFGANARKTNRARSLKELIKTGANHALVSVTLRNEGEEAFKPEVYGSCITVERRIQASSGAQFTVKNSSGAKVAQGKHDLEMILDHLSIDVNNPCTVMTQDNSRDFLHSGKDEDKYRFFMQATLLDKVRDELMYAEQNVKSMMEILSKMEQELLEKEKELQGMQERLHAAQEIDRWREDERKLVRKIAWQDVYRCQCKVQDLEETLTKDPPPPGLSDERRQAWGLGPIVMAQKAQEVAKNRDALQAAKAALMDATNQVESINERMTDMLAKQREVEQELREAKRTHRKAETDEMTASNEVRQNENQKRELESLMQKSMQLADTDTKALTAKQQAAKRQAQAQLESAQSQLRAVEEHMDTVQQNIRREQEAMRAADGQEANAKQEVDQSRKIKAQLDTQSTSNVAAFGHNVQKLLNLLVENERSFDRMPVGPIGRDLSLADAQWSTAVEACIGRFLNSFIVSSFRDKETLANLAKRAGVSVPTMYVVPRFDEPRYNIPQNRQPREGLVTMLRILGCSNNLVMNLLVDQGNVERVVLCSDDEEAFMLGCRNVPHNVKEVYTKDGTKFHKKGCSEVRLPYRSRSAPRLGVDVRERRQIVSQQLKVAEDALRSVLEQKHLVDRRLAAAKADQASLQKQLHNKTRLTQQMEAMLEELESEHTISQPDAPIRDMSELESQVLELDKKISSAKDCWANAAAAQQKAAAHLEQVGKQAHARTAAVQEAEQDSDSLSERIKKLKEKRSQAQANLESSEDIMERIKAKFEALRKNLEQEKKELEQMRCYALKACTEEELTEAGGVDTREGAMELLNKERDRLRYKISREESRVLDGVTTEYLEYKYKCASKAYKKLVDQIAGGKEPAEKLDSGVQRRKKALMDCARLTGQDVSNRFNHYMSKRGHLGRVKILHNESRLVIEVVLAGSTGEGKDRRVHNTKTLSGGERSYCTLAFTLALGASVRNQMVL
mmetsp:Transcript_10985/g.20939  ORF Transcript_10985/g.20939 Transcript_10985/m.20939 type:complete len:1058 (+) Transcript_10985:150-3323(+)